MKRIASFLVASVLVIVPLLGACSSDDPNDGGDNGGNGGNGGGSSDGSDLPKSMRVTLSGAVSAQLDCSGEEVGVGYAPGASIFTLECAKIVGTELLDIGIGPVADTFITGAEVRGPSILDIVENQGEGDRTEHSSLENLFYYDTSEDGSQSHGYVSFDRVEVLPGALLGTRYHLVGRIRAPLVRGPTEDDPSHEACIQESIDAVIQADAPRYPPRNAAVCQSKKTEMTGTFDIIQDFPRN